MLPLCIKIIVDTNDTFKNATCTLLYRLMISGSDYTLWGDIQSIFLTTFYRKLNALFEIKLTNF